MQSNLNLVDAYKIINAVKKVKEIEEIMADGVVDEEKLLTVLKRLGLKKDQIDKILEAKRKYDEEHDEEQLIINIAEAFGIPADAIKQVMTIASMASFVA